MRTARGTSSWNGYMLATGTVCAMLAASAALAQAGEPGQPASAPVTPAEATRASKGQASGGVQGSKSGSSSSANAPSASSELMLFEEIPVVVTASRNAQPISLSPVPVSVLTAEDIHYGGLTDIADALTFVPGVDIARVDRNRVGVGVRGMAIQTSERTLTLVDGRDAELPSSQATDYFSLPVFMEDIDRIEVVRGPGGAAWGANALNGVINIITKTPDKTLGLLLSSTINEWGETSSQFRWGAADGNWSWRISAGYREHKSSEDVITDDNFTSRDFLREVMVDGTALYKASTNDKFSFGVGYSGSSRFGEEFDHFFPNGGDERLDDARMFARFDHQFDDGSSGYLQWTGLFDDRNQPDWSHPISFSSNLDGQLSLAKMGNHTISLGGNFRWVRIDASQETPQEIFFSGNRINEYWAGFFAQDRIDLAPRLWLDAQGRVDYCNYAGTDWSGRIALLDALDHDQRHIVRLAAARSFRTLGPEVFDGIRTSPFYNIIPGQASNEGIWSLEAGYNGRLTDHLTLRVDGYYERYNNIISLTTVQFVPVYLIQTVNAGGADAYGGEIELDLKGEKGQLSLWYACHKLFQDQAEKGFRAFDPPPNSVGATGRLFLPDNWTANANYRYTDAMGFPGSGGTVTTITPNHRLDLTLSKSFANGQGELTLGVADVFNRTEQAGQIEFAGPTRLPGRTLFARLELKF